MKPIHLLLTFIFSALFINYAQAQVDINGDLEKINNPRKLPAGWTHPAVTVISDGYSVTLDSAEKQQGKYAVMISQAGNKVSYATVGFNIDKRFAGKNIELRGYLKTENAESAGFWLAVGEDFSVSMQGPNAVKGSTNWKEYRVKIAYKEKYATYVRGGAILAGKGKMWFDNVRLFIDGKPIEQADASKISLSRAVADTAFISNSGISNINTTPQTIKNLNILAQVWGFVKYHHTEVADGNVNMDAELFRIMPVALNAKDASAVSNVLEQWFDKLGTVPPCTNCKTFDFKDTKLRPDYGSIFDDSLLTPAFRSKLTNILNRNITKHYYVSLTPNAGNPVFEHEKAYADKNYPDAGYRLLCLFRYWNMIQYFYPNRHLIGDWNKVLPDFIPKFIANTNAESYALTVIELICRIRDTHGFLPSNNVIENYRGAYAPPFKARFIENQLVVTGYHKDSTAVKDKIKKGDIIRSINGVSVEELIKKYEPLTSASNQAALMRDMPLTYLLRSQKPAFEFDILSNNIQKKVNVDAVKYDYDDFAVINTPPRNSPGYYLLNKDIGYVYPARYSNNYMPAIKKLFANTKGIIVDMRCYPADFMPFKFGGYIKHGKAPFVKFTRPNLEAPGYFFIEQPLGIRPDVSTYKGKVVVIVDENAQSNAEYTTMAFQSSTNVTVIGSTTAGADGNVSYITLPGDLRTAISGIGVLYPDGTESQQVGVKIDKQIKPTVAGIKAGRDELLEEAVKMVMDGK
ncbi:S41 family peptidase [Mucilaginibacter auburnensis]|uniref:Peptidase S41-like protein n=1 Tax=Mucilaginibacter auburnensis TaxID=1457233 RepID=A0A2H9VS19_9SPHI|nr:S41 family peptidase [Mucilaginibacter auburnensis]PJJ83626.1 peptidase S41-like protein [Mucilaginibacter auburnensis]